VNVLVVLIPVSLILGGIGLVAFLWMLRTNQYDDPEGQAARVLSDRYDDRPAEDRPEGRSRPGRDDRGKHSG
jgi:cbb3-type cytochrome oxidase maturation protein